ncbi:aspartic peptidase domain-containing protein [Podospora fimiseda]|uniref:Aspartic peptidase domain-containing protein n=1 Tax=Podospora fimiseda TaxID=252190 RepID=A0AAN7BJ53_9PEZI|nr:aspartic peptidase domain-containing protein [Podospora fimiseda]
MSNLRLKTALAALVSFLTTLLDAAEFLEVPFTTDIALFDGGSFGPDGPWQAAAIILGTTDQQTLASNKSQPTWAAAWPSTLGFTSLLTTEKHGPDQGGVLKITRDQAMQSMSWGEFGEAGRNVMATIAGVYGNQLSTGVGMMSDLTLLDLGLRAPGYANVKAFTYAMNDTTIFVTQKTEKSPSKKFIPKVGILGLGKPSDSQLRLGEALIGDGLKGNGLVEQMKNNGVVGSNSFGMHLGSVPLKQKGSLVLGGYDTKRVVGPVGTFETQLGMVLISLVDVVLGSELGGWPYDTPQQDIGGLFNGTDDQWGIDTVNVLRRKKGSIIVNVNPTVPGIYLPNTTCANIAKHLPVTFNASVGWYGTWLWNTQDPAYKRIVNSPAYLGFVLSDTSANNITIKVPFKLLDLTLEEPYVDTPTQYLPCHDTRSYKSGAWELGRAFLQAAFYGANMDRNITFLAQAPGPSGEQAVVRAIKPDDTTIASQPESRFAESWKSHWTILEEPLADSASTDGAAKDKKLGGRAIAGVVIGSLAGVGLISAAIWFFWRRRQQSLQKSSEIQDENQTPEYTDDVKDDPNYVPELGGNGKKIHEMAQSPLVSEMAETPAFSELYTPSVPQELESPLVVSEVPGSAVVYEMPGSETWVQQETRKSQEASGAYQYSRAPMGGRLLYVQVPETLHLEGWLVRKVGDTGWICMKEAVGPLSQKICILSNHDQAQKRPVVE